MATTTWGERQNFLALENKAKGKNKPSQMHIKENIYSKGILEGGNSLISDSYFF